MKAIVIFLAATLFACNEFRVESKLEGDKLMQLSREWSAVASSGNIEKTLSYWDDDATVMAPGQATLHGKKEIRGMLESTSKIPGFKISWEPVSVTVAKSGDIAYMIERNQVTANDSSGHPQTEFNKAVTIWRKQLDGSWKNIVDTWNADPSANGK